MENPRIICVKLQVCLPVHVCIWLIPKQCVSVLNCSSLVVLSHSISLECFIERERTKCWKLSFYCSLKHLVFPFFFIFQGFVSSSHSSPSQFLTMNSVCIQCGCSNECCLLNAAKEPNASKVIFRRLCLSASHPPLLIPYLSISPENVHSTNHSTLFQEGSIAGTLKYSEINTGTALYQDVCLFARMPCVSMCMCACLLVGTVHS